MKNIYLFAFLLLFFSITANAQKTALYPQVPFDSLQAKIMLSYGKTTIEGNAYTKPKNTYGMDSGPKKILAGNVLITLYPVTPYFEEWYRMRKKMENKKTNVFLSEEAAKWCMTVKTDDNGNFRFTKMKPGKYFLQAFINYTQNGTSTVYQGSGYNNYGGRTDYYNKQKYTNGYTDRLEEFVEIAQDGQVVLVKLKN